MTRANNEVDYEARVDRSAGPEACHPWTAYINGGGYGRMAWRGRLELAHRIGWEIVNGPLPVGMKVCHTCDNPPCQNPRHWFMGTQIENIADRDRKGRVNHPAGERNPRAKLTDVQVASLRAESACGLKVGFLAEKYGVHRSQVFRLTSGRQR